jgi:hypothetical protein
MLAICVLIQPPEELRGACSLFSMDSKEVAKTLESTLATHLICGQIGYKPLHLRREKPC